MMIDIKLLFSFLKIGLFSFGGAYGAIPLIQEVVFANNWADAEMFANLVALSESTPGPIMVNMATYLGSQQAGIGGAALATAGVVFPSFVILWIVTALLQNILKTRYVQAILKGIKPCLMGIILATGIHMLISLCWLTDTSSIDGTAGILFLLLVITRFVYRKWRKKELSPILFILLAAVYGCFFY